MTDTFLYIFPAAFPALALAHFMALLSPGPDFFLILGHSVRHRIKGSLFICIGIAVGHTLYIVCAIIGWSGLKQSTLLYRSMEFGGAVYLVWLGFMLYRSSRRTFMLTIQEATSLSPVTQGITGFLCAVSNPKNAVFYLTLMTVIIGPSATILQQSLCGLWMVCVVFIWDVLVAVFIADQRVQKRLVQYISTIERVSAFILVGLGGGIMITILLR